MAWPAGYPSRGAWLFRDVTQAFDYWPRLETLSITQLHPDGLSTMEVEVVDADASLAFEDGDEHRITFRGVRVWAGHAQVANRGALSAHGPRTWRFSGQDYTAKLDDDVLRLNAHRPRELVATRVAWILDALTYPLTTANVNLPNEYVEENDHDGQTVREALQLVSDELSLHFYADFTKDLHMFRQEVVSSLIDMNDETPDYLGSFPFGELDHRTDRTEQTNAVHVKGKRHKRWVTDAASISAYGRLESSIIDEALTTVAQVNAAGQRRVNQLAEPVVDGRLTCWEPGLYAGTTFHLRSADWPDILGNYIVTSAEITAPDPHDESGEALMRTDISYTDRRRVGRFPGSGKDKDRDKESTGSGSGGGGTDIGGCCAPVPVGEAPLTTWEACVPAGTTPTAGNDASSNDDGTTIFVNIPDGSNVTGKVVLVFAEWYFNSPDPYTNDGGVTTAMSAAGFTAQYTWGWRSPYYFISVFHRVVDGSEGWGGTGATITLTVPAPILWASVAETVSGVNTDGAILGGLIGSTSGNPGTLANPYPQGTRVRHYTLIVTDDIGIVSAPPTNYTHVATSTYGPGWPDWQTLSIRVDARSKVATDLENPDAYELGLAPGNGGRGVLMAIHTQVGGDADECSEVGIIAPGPTWVGGNPFIVANPALIPPDTSVVDGDLVLESEDLFRTFWQYAAAPPQMPTQLADWTIDSVFKLETAGSLSDDARRYLAWGVVIDGKYAEFEARLGDPEFVQGVRIDGDSDDFLAVDITEGAWMHLVFHFDGTAGYAKLYEDGDADPGWQVTVPLADWKDDDYHFQDVLEISAGLGNDGPPAQVLTIRPPIITGGALAGESVDWHVVGYGDGTTTEFSTAYPYDELSLQVRVDNQVLLGSAIADMDGAGATFTLSRAPYGDPADATGSSVVEARYVRL